MRRVKEKARENKFYSEEKTSNKAEKVQEKQWHHQYTKLFRDYQKGKRQKIQQQRKKFKD